MDRLHIAIVLSCLAAATAGCLGLEAPADPEGLPGTAGAGGDGGDPAVSPSILPREHPYGLLTSVDRNGSQVRFTMEAEIRDCSLSEATLRRAVEAPDLAGSPAADDGKSWDRIRRGLRKGPVAAENLSTLDEGRLYAVHVEEGAGDGHRTWVLGRVADADPAEGTVEVVDPRHEDETRLLHASDGAERPRFLEARRDWRVADLQEGEAFGLSLRQDADGTWALREIHADREEAVEACNHRRSGDLVLHPHVGPASFPANATRKLVPTIENDRNRTLTARFQEAFLVNESVLRPDAPRCGEDRQEPGPDEGEDEPRASDGDRNRGSAEDGDCVRRPLSERFEDARVHRCTVEKPDPVDVPGRGTADAPFRVTCNETIPREEARHHFVWAEGRFVDELGGSHLIPDDRYRRVATFQEEPIPARSNR